MEGVRSRDGTGSNVWLDGHKGLVREEEVRRDEKKYVGREVQ